MRVLHINSFGRFSTGNIAGEILSALPESDEKLLIYGRDDSDYPFAKKFNTKTSAFTHVVMNKLFGRQGRYSYFNTKRILKEIDKFNPDIIHLHNLHGYYINYELLFKYIKKHDIKVVWTLHDCWAFTGFCTYFDYIKCNKWVNGCSNCPIHNQTGYKSIIDNSKNDFNNKQEAFLGVNDLTLVTPSTWLKDLVSKSFLGSYNIKVINNGINIKMFTQVDKHTFDNIIDRNKKIVLGVATPFVERKGYKDFIDLSNKLRDDCQLVMVGLSEEQIKSLPKNIIGIKRTKNQEELAELYSIADVFINLTYEDNFPTTNLEALCCGTPVITYNTGGSIESITKDNGIVVEKGNFTQLLQAISNVIDNYYDKDQISKVAKSKYSIENMVGEYIKLYSN